MGNSLRCCLACVLPCGALDLIRIVHLDGYVEEITRAITAGEILQANPNHVLSKPSSQGMVRKILILSPHTHLKRGSIYFLIPESSLPSDHSKDQKIKRSRVHHHHDHDNMISKEQKVVIDRVDFSTLDHNENYNLVNDRKFKCNKLNKCERYQRKRRSSRGSKTGVWQPHLQSITEDF